MKTSPRGFLTGTVLMLALATAAPGNGAPTRKVTKARAGTLVPTQLPRNARPVHYAVHITPDAAALTFTAQASIDFDILSPSTSITLNAADIKFGSVMLRRVGKPKVTVNAGAQTATFTFPAPLAPGRYAIDMVYSGKIYQQANGLFALDYKDPKGADKRALFTQFQAPDARRFVPSWDEPNYKATFDLTATVPADQMAVSNMPVQLQKPVADGRVEVSFQRTPKMSTYLLFFGLGEFDRITKMVGPTEVGVVVGRGNGEKGRYALDASAQIVEYFNDYFGVPYPLPKLDNVAGPGQSQFFSAMENWGAIFTFERVLLLDPKITSARGKQLIYATDAHEIAHQWFGNLVTMEWWDDLWLNEGFASWLEGKTTARFNPEWQYDLGRIDGREAAMALDAYATTHPVIQTITTVDQTNQAFDTITYQKGQAVIAMLEGFAGENVWRDGIRAYIKKHAYANTKTDDLWSAVEAAGAKGLMKVAHDFTKKPGVPLIRVGAQNCVSGTTEVALSQGQFSRDQKKLTDAKPLAWNVPVAAQILGGGTARTIVSGRSGVIRVLGCGPVIINAGQTGYYRVLYAPSQLEALRQNFGRLAPIDQLGLLNDSLRLSYNSYQPMAAALDLLSAVPASSSSRILDDAVQTYGALHEQLVGDAAAQDRIGKLASIRFDPAVKRLGLTPRADELLLVANLRSSLIGQLGRMGDPTMIAAARRLFDKLDQDPAALDGPLRTTWLNVIAYHADKATWDKLRRLARASNDQVVKSALYGLLGATRDPALARDALNLALTSEPGATTSAEIISTVSIEHPDLAVDFALANLKAVEALVDVSSRSEYVPELARGSRNPAMITKLQNHAKAHLSPGARKPVDSAIAAIRTRIATEPRIRAGILEWLKRQAR